MIEFEYWQLLFSRSFRTGLAAARIDIRHLVSESRALPRSYFQGLNFLLNEQPDRAIEAFVDAVKVDPQTVELHFALGSLFRRRGETSVPSACTRIWSSATICRRISSCRRWPNSDRTYLKAGLLDRAEEVFGQTVGTVAREEDAKRNLLEIYQLEKDWAKAIVIAAELPDIATQKDIAEYYCELAAAEMIRSRRMWRLGIFAARSSATASACAPACCSATSKSSRNALPKRSPAGSASSSRIRPISRWWRSVC